MAPSTLLVSAFRRSSVKSPVLWPDKGGVETRTLHSSAKPGLDAGGRSATSGRQSAALKAIVAGILTDLAEADYSTPEQLAALRRLVEACESTSRKGCNPPALARALVRGYAARWPDRPELYDHDELTRFAGLLVLAAGRQEAERAVAELRGEQQVIVTKGKPLEAKEEGEPESAVANAMGHLAAIFGLESGLPSPGPEVGRALAEAMAPTEDGAWQALAALATWRAPAAAALAALLEAGREHPQIALLAARAIEAPLDDESRELARRWLGERKQLLAFPGAWPVMAAYATAPDGYGSQTVFVVRRRSPRSFGLIGVVVSEMRGIADAIADRRLGSKGLASVLAELEAAPSGLFEVPLGYALDRVREGLTLADDKGLPLPFEFLLQRDLLAGLWDWEAAANDCEEPAITITEDSGRQRGKCLFSPELASRTDCLLELPALASWFLTEADGPEVRDFLRDLAAAAHRARSVAGLDHAVEEAIDRHADRVIAPRAPLLARRLEHLAYLLYGRGRAGRLSGDLSGHPGTLQEGCDLAAVAASELAGATSFKGQAFVRALLRTSFAESEYGWLLE